jgi:HlyD family secretion protein
MTANVRIVVDNRASALKVPNAALRWRPAGAPTETQARTDVPAQGIFEELKPNEAQKARLEEIFGDSQQKFDRLRDVANEADRRRQMERIRAETNARIAEILTPEQRPAWDRLLAASGGRGPASGRVYALDAGQLKAIDVRLGLTDGSSTELVSGGLDEAAEVIIGVAEAGRGAAVQAPSGGLPPGRFF